MPRRFVAMVDALANLRAKTEEIARATKAQATKKAYQSDLRVFQSWCEKNSLEYFPTSAEALTAYLIDRCESGFSISTISRSITAISQAHKLAGFENPAQNPMVRETLKGLRRLRGVKTGRAKPLVFDSLKRIVLSLGPSPIDVRDAALLTLGWTCALRRSEIVALDGSDIESVPDGLVINIQRSKTDQEGEGRKIGVPFGSREFCPVKIILRWIEMTSPRNGQPVFFRLTRRENKVFLKSAEKHFCFRRATSRLSDRTVTRILHRCMLLAGYDTRGFSGHSLRAGFCTSCAAAGLAEYAIMSHTRHRSAETMRGYIRDGSLFRSDNPLKTLLSQSE